MSACQSGVWGVPDEYRKRARRRAGRAARFQLLGDLWPAATGVRRAAAHHGPRRHRADRQQRRALPRRRPHHPRHHGRPGHPQGPHPGRARDGRGLAAFHGGDPGPRHRLSARHLRGRWRWLLRHQRGGRHDRAAARRLRCRPRALSRRSRQDLRAPPPEGGSRDRRGAGRARHRAHPLSRARRTTTTRIPRASPAWYARPT